MKKMCLVALVAALFVAAGIAPSYADGSQTATSATFGNAIIAAAMDFGSPPSGQIPILYNDHHVYSKPDVLRSSRVLAALVRNGVIMVPLRSMFEQMGATVSYNAATKGFTIQKSGASIQLTLGKNQAVINGESRPLDQGPIMYQGVALVPVRVISETMGAYVQWVPSQRVVVVRYIPATPAPTPAPTVAPTPPPTPAPTPKPGYLAYLQGGVTWGTVYNEFANNAKSGFSSGGGRGANKGSYVAQAGYLADPFAVVANFRIDQYRTTSNAFVCPQGGQVIFAGQLQPQQKFECIPITAGVGSVAPQGAVTPQTFGGSGTANCLFFSTTPIGLLATPATAFNTIDGGTCAVLPFDDYAYTLDGRVMYKVFDPRVYVGLGYLHTSNGHGYPHYDGFGLGAQKLPDFNTGARGTLTWHGSAWYYPNTHGTYTIQDPASSNFGKQFRQEFSIVIYDIGLDYNLGSSPFYLYGGFSGDRYQAEQNAPVSQTHSGPYVGLGFHI